MSSKEFLNKIRYIDMMIDCKIEQVGELKSRLTFISSPSMGEKVQSSLDPDKFSNTISKIIELENEINVDIDNLVDLKRVARRGIEQLENEVEKMVLYKRYFNNKSFEEIAVELSYSWRQIHRIHGNALNNFDKLYNIDNMTQ